MKMFKRPKVRGLCVYAALTIPIVVVSDWCMRHGVEQIAGHAMMMDELARQLHWSMGENWIGRGFLSHDQAVLIYNGWDNEGMITDPWAHIVSDNLTLTVYMGLAAQVHGLASGILLFLILGTVGVVTFMREHIPVPWRHRQARGGDIMETVLDVVEGNTTESEDRAASARARRPASY